MYRFTGGIPEWRYFNYPMVSNEIWRQIKVKKLSPDKVSTMLQEKDFILLDVRPLEFARDPTFIQGAVHCPLVYLSKYYNEIPKNCKIVLTDWAMISSPNAAKFLIAQGYEVIGVLKGGIERWTAENRPVELRKPIKEFFGFSWDSSNLHCK